MVRTHKSYYCPICKKEYSRMISFQWHIIQRGIRGDIEHAAIWLLTKTRTSEGKDRLRKLKPYIMDYLKGNDVYKYAFVKDGLFYCKLCKTELKTAEGVKRHFKLKHQKTSFSSI